LDCYTAHLHSQQAYLQAFLGEAGLESPFASGRLETVKATLETVLG
jgi:hypothetical protein